MKKLIRLVMLLMLTAAVSGCANSSTGSGETAENTAAPEDVISESGSKESGTDPSSAAAVADNKNEEAGSAPAAEENTGEPEKTDSDDVSDPSSGDIDVDLTILSSTMVYSEVYNMLAAPDNYYGKTVKMKGMYTYYHDEQTDNYYFACIIQDATACCAQGIEFILTDDYVYPDDYPEDGEEICVQGVFDSYKEGEAIYYTLRDAQLL